jgi:hypothetical protein
VFNRAVNLDAEGFARYAQFRTSKGALKASDYTIVESTATTYKLKVKDSSSLNELSLSLSFSPGIIFDASGVGLSTMTVSTTVPATSSISVASQQ